MLLLLTNNDKIWKKSELAETLDTSVRSVERYVVKLKDVGFLFKDIPGRVALQRQTQINKGLSELVYFNDEDAATLYNAIDAIESGSKVKSDLKQKLEVLFSSKAVKEKIIRTQGSKKNQKILRAIEERRRVIFKNYSSPHSATKSDRLVEPFKMDGLKQVWCYEVSSGQNKVFNISRIEQVRIQDDCWQCSINHHAGFTDAFRMISFDGSTTHVVMRLNRMAYNLMTEEYPMTEVDVTQTGENEWTYEGEVSSMKGIGRFVLGLADCIKVETPELQLYLEKFVRKNILNETIKEPEEIIREIKATKHKDLL